MVIRQTLGRVWVLIMAGVTIPVTLPFPASTDEPHSMISPISNEKQITHGPGGRILTNCSVWSPNGKWIVYDTRSDPVGGTFDGTQIEIVNAGSGDVRRIYESTRGAYCGVATFNPRRNQVVFILGPENPTPNWQYSITHRQGVLVDMDHPGVSSNLDARDITPPYTPGALRGGSHVHVFSPDGQWASFTYNDHVLSAQAGSPRAAVAENDARNIGVSVPDEHVYVPHTNVRNHDGDYFTVLVTSTMDHPEPGSDQIHRAFEEGWIGNNGYVKSDGSRQMRAIAFQGEVITKSGAPVSEVFVVDIPDNVTSPGDYGPLQGTETTRPRPPRGTRQRRLTFTADRKYPGIQGPRHWLRSSPDGSEIACLMKDDAGVVQLWLVSTTGANPPRQVSHDRWSISSTISWRPDGKRIAYVADNSVFTADIRTGIARRLTARTSDADAPLPIACVYSPDGRRIAYERNLLNGNGATRSNQIFVVTE